MAKSARNPINLALFECFLFSLMASTTDCYAVYFAIKSGQLGPTQLAIISTVPTLFGAIGQFWVPRLIKEEWLEKSIIVSQLVQALGIVGLLISAQSPFSFWMLFLSLSLYWVGGQIIGPLWIDWANGIVPPKFYKTFLATKSRLVTLSTFVLYPTMAILMNYFPQISPAHLFTVGLLARLGSCAIQIFLSQNGQRCSYPKATLVDIKPSPYQYASNIPLQLIKNFGWLFGALAMFKMMTNISSPFFLPYMTNQLHFTTLQYVMLTAIPLIGRTISVRRWGKSSSGGQIFWAMQICAVMVSFIPILWCFSDNIYYLSLVEIYSGVFWGGLELSLVLIVQNFIVKGSRRALGVLMASMSALGVVGSFIGAELLKQHMTYKQLFVASATCRLLGAMAICLILRSIPLGKINLKNSGRYLFAVLSPRPGMLPFGKIDLTKEQERDYLLIKKKRSPLTTTLAKILLFTPRPKKTEKKNPDDLRVAK